MTYNLEWREYFFLRDNGGGGIPTNILAESLADSINLRGFNNCYIGKTLMHLESLHIGRKNITPGLCDELVLSRQSTAP